MYKKIDLKEHGVVADGITNNAPLLREIFKNIEDYSEIIFPEGVILLGDGGNDEILLRIESKKHIIIRGVPGKTKILVHPNAPVKNRMGILHLHKSEYCDVYDLELDGNSQLRNVANKGVNWGDVSTLVDDCSNIIIDGSNYVNVRRVYSHHPVIDCLITGRYAGGDTPVNHHVVIEDCIFDYGYRQGISITGTDHGVIRNCRITNTAKALDLFKNDGVSMIGTSPRSGIDSETWVWNRDWLIEGCYFENNAGGHINMNDGASEHIIRDNYFVGGGAIGCETPSTGIRTINNVISNNHFMNSSISSLHGAFLITDNIFWYDDVTVKNVGVAKLVLNGISKKRGGHIIFNNNKISVDVDAYLNAGVELDDINIQLYFGNNVVACNNIFHNLISPAPVNIANASGLVFTNNVFTSSVDMNSIIPNPRVVKRDDAIVRDNSFEGALYPSSIVDAYNTRYDTVRFVKNGNCYTKKLTCDVYHDRKVYFKIGNLESMTSLFANITIRVPASKLVAEPYEICYKFQVYKQGNELIQTYKRVDEFGNDAKLLTCSGFEQKDGLVYLGFINEFSYSTCPVDIDFEIYDMSGTIVNTLNLNGVSLYENIVSPYPTSITARTYEEGEIVRSYSSSGGIYLYKVTIGGTVIKPVQLFYVRNYVVDGVRFEWIGYYQGINNIK